MPDESGAGTAVEEKEEPKGSGLSKKDLKELARYAVEYANAAREEEESKQVDPAQRPIFESPQAPEDSRVEMPEALKGLLPSSIVGAVPEIKDELVRKVSKDLATSEPGSFSVNRFPRDMDAKDFCMSRYCMAVEQWKHGLHGESAFNRFAPREHGYYQALSHYGKESKALGEYVTGQDGGFLAPEIWTNTFFDMLYPAQVMSRLPITRMNMGGRVQYLPKLVSAITVGYFAENAALTASQPQFAQLAFTARKQGAFIQIPNELIRDSAPAADQVIFQHAQTKMAVDRDTQMLFGNGLAGAPVGLINATNVGSYTIAADTGNGGSPSYSDFVSVVNAVRQLNNSTNVPVGQTDCTGVVGAVRLEQTVAALKDSNNRPLWAYGLNQIGRVPAPGWLGVPNWVLTNIVPVNVTKGTGTTCSYVIGGDWQYLIYMMRQDVEFLATNVGGTAFQNDQTWIRLISRYDVGVIHPEAFTVAAGALA